jgi:hypothetical protein
MKKMILISILFCPIFLFGVTLQEALSTKLVKVQSLSTIGGHHGKSLSLLLKNNQKKHFRIEISIGTIFEPADSSQQPLILTESQAITLAPNEIHQFDLVAYCCNAPKTSPGKGNNYTVGRNLVEGSLLSIVKFLVQKSILDVAEIQNAIWCATNQHRAEGLQNEELKQFVAKETGQKLRQIQILYHQEAHPGEAAFSNNALKIKGLFKYSTEKDIVADLGLYDNEGKLIKFLQKNLQHVKGHHRFGFNFEISNIKHGQYFIKLVSGKATIGEMDVEF